MGCEQSSLAVREDAYGEDLQGVGQTERQISRMQKAAMNNTQSSGSGAEKTPPKLDEQGFLLPEEVARRTFSSISNKEVTLGTLSNVTHAQFAHWTQRGYYPDDPHKQNQDEFGAHLNFAGEDRDAMFAVYDGHGQHGHECARFAQERLPKAIAKHVRKSRCQKYQKSRPPAAGKKGAWNPSEWPMLSRSEYESCCRKAFLEVNQAMHDASEVVDTLSGTTAISVNFHGNFAAIGNVGDSRAIVGHRVKGSGKDIGIHFPITNEARPASTAYRYNGEEEKNDIDDELEQEATRSAVAFPVIEPGSSFQTRQRAAPGTSLVAIPLSKDQTSYRKDERDRVKALGASVMSIDQMQGKGKEEVRDWGEIVLGDTLDIEGDSPRLWMKGKEYPGCAFTRSMGDSMSEAIGVTAAPEMLCTEITQNDEYLVVASDGIFEFLTNQAIIDLCAASESPLVACEKIVKAAYGQWLTYKNRADDITIVVCFLQNFNAPRLGCTEGTTEDLIASMASVYGERSSRMPPPPESVLALTQHTEGLASKRHRGSMTEEARIEPEVVAYVSQEAHVSVVKDRAPSQPMTFENMAMIDAKIDDSSTAKTASITTADDGDNSENVLRIVT